MRAFVFAHINQFRRFLNSTERAFHHHFSAACLGTSLDVPTLEGDKRIKVPAGIQAGTKIRLKGCGVKPLGSNTKGDLYVKITIQVPGSLNAAQKKLVEELAENGL